MGQVNSRLKIGIILGSLTYSTVNYTFKYTCVSYGNVMQFAALQL